MSRNPLSLKQLQNSENDNSKKEVYYNRMPKYIVKPPKFSCPISVNTLWHHGMEYKECPILKIHRDMTECFNCKLNKEHGKGKNQYQRNNNKDSIPVIKKTYTSE